MISIEKNNNIPLKMESHVKSIVWTRYSGEIPIHDITCLTSDVFHFTLMRFQFKRVEKRPYYTTHVITKDGIILR